MRAVETGLPRGSPLDNTTYLCLDPGGFDGILAIWARRKLGLAARERSRFRQDGKEKGGGEFHFPGLSGVSVGTRMDWSGSGVTFRLEGETQRKRAFSDNT